MSDPFDGSLLRGQTQRCRVLRGGAFNNNENNVRCAVRNRNNPNNRNMNIGFRVVASIFFGDKDYSHAGIVWRELSFLPNRGKK